MHWQSEKMCVLRMCVHVCIYTLICATVPASEPGNRLTDARDDRQALESWQPGYFSLPLPSSPSLHLPPPPHTPPHLLLISHPSVSSLPSLLYVCLLPWHKVIAYGSSHNPILSLRIAAPPWASHFLQNVNLDCLSI